MKEIVCDELLLSIWHDGQSVRVHLEDPMNMADAEVTSDIGVTTMNSRGYHLREAIVIGLRQVVTQAFEKGMMTATITKLPAPVIAKKPEVIRDPWMEDDIFE